ncbi:hypothetical protein [Brevundimonas lenta]|uniref:Uncharacterized protein n=1 Tax=Brevundimonas lenta TaxID=424796 RepID=A0A7W6JBF3_9CAUL|nr:hypothetical protein [Brevundimonas lenta]MBB4082004.1 hypothetical protein [Brevundimonas lenta]
MSYGADFATADPANAPLDAPILLGADPVLWVAGLLILLAALMAGYWYGARSRRDEGDATPAIWKVIDKAAKDAMKADDNALKARAEDLLGVIKRRLGHTIAFVSDSGLADSVSALRAAVAGRRHAPHGHGHDHDHGHDEHHDHGDDHGHGDHDDAHHDSASAASAAAAGNITIVNVAPAAPAKADKPEKPGAQPRDMTAREQTDALRLAVAAFNQHWRDERARVGEMRAALAELSGRAARG